jgi:hypothetical protein
MKIPRQILLLLSLVLWIAGCATSNPNYDPKKPVSETNQPYLANKSATQAADTAAAVAPLVPPPYGTILGGIGVLVGAAAGIFAKVKNDQANTHATALNQLAESVVAQGPSVTQKILAHAADNMEVFPAVSDAVNRNTP